MANRPIDQMTNRLTDPLFALLRSPLKQWSKRRLPQVNGRIYLPSLSNPITIRRDKWGAPHIRATTRADCLFAQGFVHAQDRLWQMELNRRAANGTLSAVFGKTTLDTDRLTRTLGFARRAQTDWRILDDDMKADVIAYTTGVNTYLENEFPLPVEFSLLRHSPTLWRPLDTLAYGRLQMWALTNGASSELVNAHLIETLGSEKAHDLGIGYPAENPVTLPDGVEFNRLTPAGLEAGIGPFLGKGQMDGAGRGSNGWVVAARHSSTGHAILANDMHLPLSTPSLWYCVHLHSGDGLHVTGFSQPGLPYVLVGHNGRIAWGATLAYTDSEDLFVEKLHPRDPTRYQFRGSWRQADVYEEHILVRGSDDHVEQVIETRHGPMVSNVLGSGHLPVKTQAARVSRTVTPLALSSVALKAAGGMAGFARLNDARHWDDFIHAAQQIEAPTLNLLYADTNDNIGHVLTGRVPVRHNSNGLTPVPGWTGDHEWDGYVPVEAMPYALNPVRGYIVSANHKLVDDNYPHFLGRVWRNGYRARRLHKLITGQPPISPDDCRRFQLDFHCQPGLELAAQLEHLQPLDPDARLALRLLQAWDGWLGPESIGGAVYKVFLYRLTARLLSGHMDSSTRCHFLGQGPHPILNPINEFQGYWLPCLLKWLREAPPMWALATGSLDAVLEQALADATAELRRRLGDDPQQWQWGQLHRVSFPHVFARCPPLGSLFSHGPFPIGGDMDTVAQTSILPQAPYDNNAISISARHIIDLADWDNAVAILAPGQSGQLGSPHYGDLIDAWRQGASMQMAWSETAVTAVTVHTLTLAPGPGTVAS